MRKHLKFIALILLAALILWWFGRGLNWTEVREAVGRSDGRLLALALLVVCVTYGLRAYRWRALLAPLTPASMRELFVATTVGFGAVFLFGRAGEVVRPVVLPLRDRRVRPAASFVTIMLERLCDSVCVVVLFALNLLWFRPTNTHGSEFSRVRLVGLLLLAVLIAGLFALAWFRRRSRGAIKWVDKRLAGRKFIPYRVRHAVVSLLEQLAGALSILADAREASIVSGWTIALWGSIVLADWLVLRAFGLPFGLGETVFVMGWALVGSLVPTPGGAAGAFHAATAAGLIFLGVAREEAAAVSIILHFILFGPAVVFGLYYFLRGEVNITKLRQLTSSEEVEHAVEDEIIHPPGDEEGGGELKVAEAGK
ncbi:MAG TPA: lysylphosphatidylglycerol synthase transmembrane domain-containing protein [Pyrinomonadaceae bacterium]